MSKQPKASVKFTPKEHRRIRTYCARKGISFQEWARRVLLKALREGA